MSAQRKSTKLVPLGAAAFCLLAASACSGRTAASSPAPATSEAVNLAGSQGSASGQNVTIYACLAGGNLTQVSTAAAPKCPVKSVPVQWNAQSGPAPAGASTRHTPPPATLRPR